MFYIQKDGDCVSQTYPIDAGTWAAAKKVAWEDLEEGDLLAECGADAIEAYPAQEGYYYIDKKKCRNYAILKRGAWINTTSGEDFRKDIWFFSDDGEGYLNVDGEPYDFDLLKEEH